MQISFLHNHAISIGHVENRTTKPYSKDDQYICAFMSEIVSVFKDIAQLNPLFRDQITNLSINQVASNVFDEQDKLADFAAAVSTEEVGELQHVLKSLSVDAAAEQIFYGCGLQDREAAVGVIPHGAAERDQEGTRDGVGWEG